MGLTNEYGDVQLMGRMDDILKVSGHKINPREVESVLQRHPGVAEAGCCSTRGLAKKHGGTPRFRRP